MAKKPNYGQERAQRERDQRSKQQEKNLRREEESLKRKALREAPPEQGSEPEKT